MTTSRIISLALLAVLILGGLFIYANQGSWDEATRAGSLFASFLGGGIILAILVFMNVLPWIGDTIGGFFYGSGEQITDDGSGAAVAKLAQGDYEGAIREYEKLRAQDPDDSFVVGEIAKIHAEKLEDPEAAIAYLTEVIEGQEWSEEDAGGLLTRMVDVHADALDFPAARSVLEQIIESLPGTRHAANANHRLQQLEEEEFLANQKQQQEARKDEALASTEDDVVAEEEPG